MSREPDQDPIPVMGEAAVTGRASVDAARLDGHAAADASLVALVGRLSTLLAESDLSELEVQAGSTSLVLRKPVAAPVATAAALAAPGPVSPAPVEASAPGAALAAGAATAAPSHGRAAVAPDRPAGHSGRLVVAAPLTGVWYSSASPGSPAFVTVGSEITVGQVIGLIEAMKLFNEIKSDRAGRVVRVVPENGSLVRAKQPLVEVEPL
jgi:acetyl-CoA carboxylase biotin carboxyl carrier protein